MSLGIRRHQKQPPFVPTTIILNGGLHALMRNWTLPQFVSGVDDVLQTLQKSPMPTRVMIHDITHVRWKELPPWKRHMNNQRVKRMNKQIWNTVQRHLGACSAFSQYDTRKDILFQCTKKGALILTMMRLSDLSARLETEPVQYGLWMATNGDGVHYNQNFSYAVGSMDLAWSMKVGRSGWIKLIRVVPIFIHQIIVMNKVQCSYKRWR